MISSLSSDVVSDVQNLIAGRAKYLGLLDYPPVDMGSQTENHSQGYARQSIGWRVVRTGFLTMAAPVTFTGLDSPLVVMALGVFDGVGGASRMVGWGALDTPLTAINGTIQVAAGAVSIRIG